MSPTSAAWHIVHRALAREFGVFRLGDVHDDDFEAIANYFLKVQDVARALDIVEVVFEAAQGFARGQNYYHANAKISPDAAARELNERFAEHAVGYSFINGQIIQKDTEVLHQSIVLPVLTLLHEKEFSGANEEYLSAHEHYRHGKYKECLNDCLKSFESTMKTICKQKRWSVDPNATSAKLVETCLKNDLIPAYLLAEIGALRSVLEAGIPTVRNRLGAHGQGATPIVVPSHYASYVLNLTGATISFLVASAEA